MSRRFRRRSPYSGVGLVLLAALVAWQVWHGWRNSQLERAPENLTEGVYHVQRVVDGDTLLLTNQARVRLQGVDTPETVKPDYPVEPWGPEASEFTKEFVGDGEVKLTFDVERQDVYGRFLAYVWKDGRLLNEELLKAGLARAELGFRYRDAMKRLFQKAENDAKQAQRGIWSAEQPAAAAP